jgi:4-aminobutyrate aminotransferase-like enzyme
VHGNVIRVLSPLVIRESELREGLDIIEAALEELDVPAALAAG